MPRPKTIDKLPSSVRQELMRKIIGNGYAKYEDASEWLFANGFDISKSAVHRFGQELKARRENSIESDLAGMQHSTAMVIDLVCAASKRQLQPVNLMSCELLNSISSG